MKKSSREKLNLFFSAFLVIGYIVCMYFFLALTKNMDEGMRNFINAIVFALFGLVVFYATRVGDGIPVKRFSPIVLCVLVVPALFIIIATLATAFPLHEALAATPEIMMVAAIALGYGIPYTFLSGFEMIEEPQEETAVVEGGLAQELSEIEEDVAEPDDTQVATEEDIKELETIDGVEETEEETNAE